MAGKRLGSAAVIQDALAGASQLLPVTVPPRIWLA
jgi:hypothetical protein